MTRNLAVLLAIGLLAAPLAGCLSFLKDDEPVQEQDADQKKAEERLGEKGLQELEDLASATPKDYEFLGQTDLPQATLWVNGSVGSEANAALEGNRDQGGIEYNTIIRAEDVSSFVPPGQPTEIFIKLYWDAKEGNSADYDIYVNVPGTHTAHSPFKSEQLNWNRPTKTLTVNTVGVAGGIHEIGVQAASGITTEPVPYTMYMRFTYAKDVLTPGVPYAFDVPANASGIILESVKADGDDHITSEFVVIGPNDELVDFVEFNDLAIPTESVFVPVNGPGEYVFWAHYMHGGFLSLRADAPLENLQARPLDLVEDRVSLDTAPTPGMLGRDWGHGGVTEGAATEMSGQKEATFSADAAFPLAVSAWIGNGATLGTQVRISSSAGLVHDLVRAMRYDDDSGSIGLTGDHDHNNVVNYANIAKGAYKVEYVINGQTEVGYSILTYKR